MNFLQRLKTETRGAHLELESALPLGQPDLTLAQYGLTLQAFSAVVPALEQQLLTLPFPTEFQVRAVRSALLLDDLRVLERPAADPVRDWSALTAEQGLGALYVLEGSRLGGAVIARTLGRLGLSSTRGASYFAVTPDLPQRWKAFQGALATHAVTADEEAIIAGATLTFDAFLRAWQQSSPANAAMV